LQVALQRLVAGELRRAAERADGEWPEAIDAVQGECTVQSVDRMLESGMELPPWLDGTPIVVDTWTKQARKGTVAYEYLREFATSVAERSERELEAAAEVAQRAKAASRAAVEAAPAAAPLEMQGVLPPGERYLHDPDEPAVNFSPDPGSGVPNDAKLTDVDLERYMELRNKQLPHMTRQAT